MSQAFLDGNGRRWVVEVDVAALKRVRTLTGIDLLRVNPDGVAERLQQVIASPVDVGDVLYCLCKPQADRERVTDEQFGQLLRGDVYAEAVGALVEGIISFYPSPVQKAMRRVMQESRQSSPTTGGG